VAQLARIYAVLSGAVTRKILPSLALAVVLAGVLLAPAGDARTPRTSARLSSCHFSADPIQRSFDLAARIRRIAGTRRMAIRFDVQVLRPGTARYVAVRAAGFRTWLKSDRGVRAYERFRTVNGLEAPARYRVKVGYRWYSRTGKVMKTVWRTTRTCSQPDPRPDLRVRAFVLWPASATTDRYQVVVRNAGPVAAQGFRVTFVRPDGSATTKGPYDLGPGDTRLPTFTGPRCTSGAPTVTVDPDGVVDEFREWNNTATAGCDPE
jgi:CARDB